MGVKVKGKLLEGMLCYMQRFNKFIYILIYLLLTVIATVGVLITPVLSEYNGKYWLLDFLSYRRLNCLIYGCMFSLVGILWKRYIHRVSCASVIPAITFSTISVAEGCLKNPVLLYCASMKAVILALVGFFMVSCLVLELVYYYLDTILAPKHEVPRWKITSYSRRDILTRTIRYGFCIAIFWAPWAIMCFPGNMNWDTGTSILFHLGLEKNNVNNPFFQNIIFGTVYQLGCFLGNVDLGVFLYVLCQSVILAMTLGLPLSCLEYWGASRLWRIALIGLYGLCPYFPIYAFTMGKDSNFAVASLLFISLLAIYTVQGKDFVNDWKKIVGLACLAVVMGLLRNHGAWIGVGCMTIQGVSYVKRTKKFPRLLAVAIVSVIFVVTFIPSILGIPKEMTKESLSIPLQQTARYVMNHGDQVTSEERQAIDAVIPYEKLSEYNPVLADSIKTNVRLEVSNEEWSSFLRVWRKQMFLHPITYLEAFYYQTYGYYSTEAVPGAKPMRQWGYDVSKVLFELTELRRPENSESLQLAKWIDQYAMDIPLLGKFQKAGIYTWILIIAIAYLVSRRKNWALTFLLPSIAVIVACCLSPVNGYLRYAFSAAVMIPIMVSCAIYAPNVECSTDEKKRTS